MIESFNNFQRPVVVAMVAMRMMKSPIHQIINMIAMRNGGVAAIRAMNVLRRVFPGGKTGRAFVRIAGINRNLMLVHMVAMRMMQMAVVKIVHVSFVLHRRMSATRAVDMRMARVSRAGMFAHNFFNFTLFIFLPRKDHPMLLLEWQEMFLQVTCI